MLLALAVLLATGDGGVVTEMSPAVVAEAVAFGRREKEPKEVRYGGYRMKGTMEVDVRFTTPFLRVAMSAAKAARLLLPFDQSSIDPSLLRHEVEFAVDPYDPTDLTTASPWVERAVFRCAGEIVQPIAETPMPRRFEFAVGVSRDLMGVRASFPVSVVSPECELLLSIKQERKPRVVQFNNLATIR